MSEPLPERSLQRLLRMAQEPEAPDGLPSRYRWVREIGRGGMGVVHEVFDRQLARAVAWKVCTSTDEPARRRFAREAEAAARIVHPHVAEVHDAGPGWLSMRLVRGGPLPTVGPGPDLAAQRRASAWIRDAARALHHAHGLGLVHRDVKPSNLLLEGEHVFVVDFGLSKLVDTSASLSHRGTVLGTPAFAPPEQTTGDGKVDARSDVYGLGASLYWCLSGSAPFADTDLPRLLRAVAEDEPKPLTVDRELAAVVACAMAKEPKRRYATANELAQDLERWLAHEPVHARAPSRSYRLQKWLRRHRTAVRATLLAAALAVTVTAAVLVPRTLRETAARQAADAAVALADHAQGVLQDAATFARLGEHAAAFARLDTAITRVETFVGEHDSPRVRYLLARLLRARGHGDEARRELDLALASDPSLGDARFERGLALASLREPTKAEIATAIADLATPPREGSVLSEVDRLFGEAERQRLTGERDSARETLLEVLEYDPVHTGARLALSRLALAAGDADLARYYAASAVDLQQGFGPVYLARERQTLPVRVLGLEDALVDFAPDLRGEAENALALAHRAIVQLRRGLRLSRDGDAVSARTALENAIADLDRTLELHADVAGAHVARAVCLQVLADRLATNDDPGSAGTRRQAALRALQRAIDLAPRMPEAHFDLGLLHLRLAQIARGMGRIEASRASARDAGAAFERAMREAGEDWSWSTAARERLRQAREEAH